MSKFNTATVRPAVHSPIATTGPATTYEGGKGWERDPKSELFLLAVSNMVGESDFYEGATERDERFRALVRQVAVEDGTWTANMIGWLRGVANMRSASIVAAAEAVHARLEVGLAGNRGFVDEACQRADEPGELLAYWVSRFGRAVPKPVKRGLSDAIGRLYNERALLKYDAPGKGYRFGDVIELAHPTPQAPWQGDLFKYAIDRRHNRPNPIPDTLTTLRARTVLMAFPAEKRRTVMREDIFRQAGMTWESLAGWLQGPMDREAWHAIIPSMGYMALLRNLRNFDEAGVSDEVAKQVAAKLADPEQVAKSRQLPMRFLSAYRNAPSLRWAYPLEQALGLSLNNVPTLPGRSLILVDRSGSMFVTLSARSDLTRADAAAVFGTALALRCGHADLVEFGTSNAPVAFRGGGSVLRIVEDRFHNLGGTWTREAIQAHYRPGFHDRVLIVTDEQVWYGHDDPAGAVPAQVPVYTWNLGGYRAAHGPSGSGQRHTFGGLSDAAFGMVPLLEAGRDAAWPF